MVSFQRVPEDSLWEKTRYITLAYLAPTFIYNYRHFLVLLFESEVFKILNKGDSEKRSGILYVINFVYGVVEGELNSEQWKRILYKNAF